MSEYREFLNVKRITDAYDVGFHPAWRDLRLTIKFDGDDGREEIELFLSVDEARALSSALSVAATQKEWRNE
jgi:hypothetical protein